MQLTLENAICLQIAVQHVVHSSEDRVSDSADGGWITSIDGFSKLLNNEGLSQRLRVGNVSSQPCSGEAYRVCHLHVITARRWRQSFVW